MSHRRRYKYFVAIIVCVVGLAGSGILYWPMVGRADTTTQVGSFVPNEVLVKFKGADQVDKIELDKGVDVLGLINQYAANDVVEYIEPNYIFTASAFPNDPEYVQQLYLSAIDAKTAWSKELLIRQNEKINRRSIIAVLDTGVDLDHPDLAKNIWHNPNEALNGLDDDRNGYIDDITGWDFITNDGNPNPDFSAGFNESAVNHGTIVAGVAAAGSNNGEGITGVSWFSDIMPLRVLNSQGSGDADTVIRAIDYAVANGADVINMSFVGVNFSNSLFQAIQRAYNAGVVVVAAAGNTDPSVNGVDLDFQPSYPVCYKGANNENIVIGVASIDNNFKKSGFSNYGSCIDVVAPGESFFSTQVKEPSQAGFEAAYNGYWSGTSLSAPVVSGIFATLRYLRPEFDLSRLQATVLNSAVNVDGINPNFKGRLGHGKIDFNQALEAAVNQRLLKQDGGQSNYIVAGLGGGSFPHLKIMQNDGSVFKEFFAYAPSFPGVINVASGDVTGDGREEIVVGPGVGGGPHIRVFDREGLLLAQFFAFDSRWRTGATVAIGDVTGDSRAEIIVGAGPGVQPLVRVFDSSGTLLKEFLAYSEKFKGGVTIAVGDVTGDGRDDIVTGAGSGGGPHVRVFNAEGIPLAQFFAYNQNFSGGVSVAVGNVNGSGAEEIIVGAYSKSVPTVRVFGSDGVLRSEFFAYDANVLTGVNIASGDADNDGLDDIITGKGIGGDAEIRVFDQSGNLKFKFNAKNGNYKSGTRPSVLPF